MIPDTLNPKYRHALDVEASMLREQALELRRAMSFQLSELGKHADEDDHLDGVISSLQCLEDRAAAMEQRAAYVWQEVEKDTGLKSVS